MVVAVEVVEAVEQGGWSVPAGLDGTGVVLGGGGQGGKEGERATGGRQRGGGGDSGGSGSGSDHQARPPVAGSRREHCDVAPE
jgi:hypothetical protein